MSLRLAHYAAGIAFLLAGCHDERGVEPRSVKASATEAVAPLAIESPASVAAGAKTIVKFSRALDAANARYWITIIAADQADSQWGAWGYVETAAREAELPPVSTPGRYEIRLHGNYPARPYHVVARAPIEVVPASAPSPSTAADVAAQPAAASNVPAGDVEAMAKTDFGTPATSPQQTLHIQRWATDGGGQERVQAREGHRFLVILFPEARSDSNQIFYDSRQIALRIRTIDVPLVGPTTGGASSPSTSVASDGTRVFQRGVWVSFYPPTPELPFGVAFEVPRDARSGTLTLGERTFELSW